MTIYDPYVMKDIIKLSVKILQANFYYDEENIGRFLDIITAEIAKGLVYFEQNGEQEILDELKRDKIARIHFTCYFTSANLRHVFLDKLHFTEQELVAFDNILPKYNGGELYEVRPRFERKNH